MKKWWLASAALLAADRASKLWAEAELSGAGRRALWPGVVGFAYARNTGVAFSLGSGGGAMLIALTAALVALVLWLYFREKSFSRVTRGALLLVAAGGLGNLIDRLAYGYVIDFIELQFVRFAVFNVADMMICAGALLAGLGFLRKGGKRGAVDG